MAKGYPVCQRGDGLSEDRHGLLNRCLPPRFRASDPGQFRLDLIAQEESPGGQVLDLYCGDLISLNAKAKVVVEISAVGTDDVADDGATLRRELRLRAGSAVTRGAWLL